MAKNGSTIGLKDLARETGLSTASVSRILRGKDRFAPETRQRVLELARQHKYRPNLLVQGIQTGRTRTIGVLLPFTSEFFAQVLQGIHDALVEADHVPITLWCHDELAAQTSDQPPAPSELTQILRLIDRRVDGVILRPVDDAISDDYLHAVWERGLPLIAIDRELAHTHADFIGVDDLAIGRQAAELLLGAGHRHLGMVAGPDSVTTSRDRRRGFQDALAASPAQCHTVVDETFGHHRPPVHQLLSLSPRPTAVFAANDEAAANVYAVARELQLRIPQDLSVIGVGNLRLATHLFPQLTTFEQHPKLIGSHAVETLFERLEAKAEPQPPIRLLLEASLIPRDSVAPPQQ